MFFNEPSFAVEKYGKFFHFFQHNWAKKKKQQQKRKNIFRSQRLRKKQFELLTFSKPSEKLQGWLPRVSLGNIYKHLKYVININERYHIIAIVGIDAESFRATKKSEVLFLTVVLAALFVDSR